MNTKKFAQAVLLSMLLVSALLLGGCSQPEIGDHEIMEEHEITVDYLSGEYAQQLLRDGGEEILGTIEIKKEANDKYELTVHSMVIVESSITDEGYYIADKNLAKTVPLDADARVTYIKSDKEGPEVIPLADFINLVGRDTEASRREKEGAPDSDTAVQKLYDVYIIGDHALMLLARELPGA